MRMTLLRGTMHILTWRPKEHYRCQSIEDCNFKGCIILDKTKSEDTDLNLGSRVRARQHARTRAHEYVCNVRTCVYTGACRSS